jgi:3-oxoacyl-[acyl-carrier protein] reductase
MDTQIRSAIVTGGSRGIGRSIALRLATEGFAVVINYASNNKDAAETAAEIKAKGGKAIETLTTIAAKELSGKNITVNAVAPGPTGTDLFLNGKPAEVIERLSKAPPLERLGTPEDIAAVVAFLAGPDGAWVNGQTIRVNGGII